MKSGQALFFCLARGEKARAHNECINICNVIGIVSEKNWDRHIYSVLQEGKATGTLSGGRRQEIVESINV